MKNRILFLDVDGPMIPGYMYFINKNASMERTISPISVVLVNKLIERSGAKIVMNTAHNNNFEAFGVHIKDDLIKAGIPAESFHKHWQTGYPDVGRLEAIKFWLAHNDPEADWICFDDADFTYEENLLLVDFEIGLTTYHFNQALDRWKIHVSPLLFS